MKYEKPLVTVVESEDVCNEVYSSGVVVAAAIAVVLVIVTQPAH